MSNTKKEIVRMQSVIESDRVSASNNFTELLINDINKVLREYFDFRALPKLKIEKFNGEYFVNLSISAVRIKNFSNI